MQVSAGTLGLLALSNAIHRRSIVDLGGAEALMRLCSPTKSETVTERAGAEE
jgi:hypothetical protein